MINFIWGQIGNSPPIVLVSDKDGEFGFIKYQNGRYEFKITEEKYLSLDEISLIASYMKGLESK